MATTIAAAAAAMVVAAAGTVILFGGDDEGSLGTAEPTATLPPPSTAVAPRDDTDHARLPVAAVPEGWDVVEWGGVRMAVPGEWRLTDDAAGCESVRVGTSVDALTVGCAGLTVTIRPDADDTAEPTDMINGIPVADLGGDGCIGCPQFISSPVWGGQVGIGVDHAGTDLRMTAEQIRDTITVSGRWRAANEPPPSIPTTGWVETRHLGVTLTVPWPLAKRSRARVIRTGAVEPGSGSAPCFSSEASSAMTIARGSPRCSRRSTACGSTAATSWGRPIDHHPAPRSATRRSGSMTTNDASSFASESGPTRPRGWQSSLRCAGSMHSQPSRHPARPPE